MLLPASIMAVSSEGKAIEDGVVLDIILFLFLSAIVTTNEMSVVIITLLQKDLTGKIIAVRKIAFKSKFYSIMN